MLLVIGGGLEALAIPLILLFDRGYMEKHEE